MAAQPTFVPGQVYTSRDDQTGRYEITKILHVDESVVVCRRYVNRFDERPTAVPDDLRLGMTLEELQRGEIGVGWAAVAIDAAGFAQEERILVGEEPVSEEERASVRDALYETDEDAEGEEGGESAWARLKGIFGRGR